METKKAKESIERSFLNSPGWTEPPKFMVGDRVFVRPLGINSVIKGVLFLGDNWIYYIKHNGAIKKMLEFQMVGLSSYLDLKQKFNIGETIQTEKYGEKLVHGLILDCGWKYFIYPQFNVLISIEENEIT